MSASLAGPETYDTLTGIIRFRGEFVSMPEGGDMPVGCCPFHTYRIAWYMPAPLAEAYGPAWSAGWNGIRFARGNENCDVEHFPSRQAAEVWLLRGEPLTDRADCGCPAPRTLEAAR